jgi:hypothetical protein
MIGRLIALCLLFLTSVAHAQIISGGAPVTQPANIAQVGGLAVVPDPCQAFAHTYTPISINTASTTTIVAGTASKKTYICHMMLAAPVSVSVGIVEGTGTNCSTVSAGVIGGSTAATGMPLAGGPTGFVSGDGMAAVAATATAADNLCLAFSSAQQVSGVIVTVQK